MFDADENRKQNDWAATVMKKTMERYVKPFSSD